MYPDNADYCQYVITVMTSCVCSGDVWGQASPSRWLHQPPSTSGRRDEPTVNQTTSQTDEQAMRQRDPPAYSTVATTGTGSR